MGDKWYLSLCNNIMSDENIFSALAKYNSAIDENYLTESFVFVINALLQKERPIGLEILAQLCVKNNEFSFDMGEDISVSTQETWHTQGFSKSVLSPSLLLHSYRRLDNNRGPKCRSG